MGGLSRLVAVWLAAIIVSALSASAQQCQLPPAWSINGRSPMVDRRGDVVVVSLLEASWSLCLWQASGLQRINNRLQSNYNITDIQFIIINSKLSDAVDNVGELTRRVSFPVYQDTEAQGLWELLRGGKDDTLIYDRCGKLTLHIPYPDSLLSKRHFQVALFEAYFSNPCSCDPTQPNADTSRPAEHQNHEAMSPRRHETRHGHHHSRHSAQNRHH